MLEKLDKYQRICRSKKLMAFFSHFWEKMAVSVFLNRKSCGSIKHATNKEFTSYTSGKCFYFWRVKYTIEHQSPNPLSQGRIFIFGALAYFKLGAPLEGLQRLMSYKSALHVLATFTGQVVPIHKHITLFWISSISGTRATSAALHIPNWGAGHAVTGDPKFRA